MSRVASTIVTLLLAIAVGFGIYAFLDSRNVSEKLKAAEVRLAKAEADLREANDKLVLSEQREIQIRDEAAAERGRLNAEVVALRAQKQNLVLELNAEKAKTSTLSNSELAAIMCSYIGTENAREQSLGGFTLTRRGGENTVNIFKEYTFTLKMWNADKEVILKREETLANYENVVVPSYDRQLNESRTAYDKAVYAFNECSTAFSLAKKDARKRFWKGVVYGAGGTGLVVLMLRIFSGLGTLK